MVAGRRVPVLTVVALALTAAATATRLFGDGVLDALRRDPGAIGQGQLWRLLSPVLVQSDGSLIGVLGVFVPCALIGTVGERFLGRRRWIVLYLIGALAGHGLGEAFQPDEGGTSVAFMGILGGLGAYALFERDPALRRWRWHAALAIALSILDTALGDIHGVAFLAGWLSARRGHCATATRPRRVPGRDATAPADRAAAHLAQRSRRRRHAHRGYSLMPCHIHHETAASPSC
jgi:membrane associated rhomboid family serine protease